jgi:uncharacterized Zn finger protein
MKPPTTSNSRNCAIGLGHVAETEFMNVSSPINNSHKAIRRLQSGKMPYSIKHPFA